MFGKKVTAGLDIGQDSVKCATSLSDKYLVRDMRLCATMADRQTRDQLASREELIRCVNELVKVCQKEVPGFGKHVSASVQGSGSVARYLELPLLKPKELSVAVNSQASKYVPFPLKDMTLSFVNVPQLSTAKKKSAVFFIAEQNETLEELKAIMKATGLNLNRIETPVLSLSRLFALNHRFPKDEFFAIIHMGFRYSFFIVLRDRYPYFVRELSISGRDFTYALQMGGQCSWREAEETKLKYDVLAKETAIEPFITRWLDDVKRSIEFFVKQFPGENFDIKKIFITGGTAAMKNLDLRLSSFIALPVESDRWDRIKRSGVQGEGSAEGDDGFSTFSVAMGLTFD
ncbi:MAG: pilus assembly protein PilM [Candidatus Eremiobacteraeota bacterium]|nr:pilus assembly protein PilM [Candidatus Eremiobacteraeota bacterium]